MIWDGCGDCKYCWPLGKEGSEYFYCIPRERRCEGNHYGNYRDKECGLVEAISVGNLKKLLDGIEDSVVADVWFHMPLTKLGRDSFFGAGTLDELYEWKDPNDETDVEKEVYRNMFLQKYPERKSENSEKKETVKKIKWVVDRIGDDGVPKGISVEKNTDGTYEVWLIRAENEPGAIRKLKICETLDEALSFIREHYIRVQD